VTNSYIHNSGSSEEQKDFVKSENFATVPLPFGPAKKRYSFYFSETLTGFKAGKNRDGAWKFMSWAMEPEPHYMYSKGLGCCPRARPSPSARSSRGTRRSPASSSRSVLDRQPVPRLRGLGRQARLRGRAALPAGARRQAHGREFLDKFAEVLSKNMS